MQTIITNQNAPVADSQFAKRMARRVKFYKRIGLFGSLPEDMEVTRATDPDTVWQAWSLVHDCYVDCEYILPSPTGVRVRGFEAMPEMATFVVRHGRRVVAVMSVVGDTDPLGLPSDKVYGDAIDSLRNQKRNVCEITNLAVDPEYRNQPVFSELTQAAFAHARCMGYDDMFISISPDHIPFFGEVLCFDPFGGKRVYDHLTEDVVVGMRLNISEALERASQIDQLLGDKAFLADFYFNRNQYVQVVRRWAVRAVQLFNDPEKLRQLFVDRACLELMLSRRTLAAVAKRWRPEVFSQVFPNFGQYVADTSADTSRVA
ncbi:MAG: GNAT family N-acetyltransferase [Phycisphaerae bacterium]